MPEKSNQSVRVDLSLKYILGKSGSFLLNGTVTYFFSKNNKATFFPKADWSFLFHTFTISKKSKKKQ